jgi:hypothetical protein
MPEVCPKENRKEIIGFIPQKKYFLDKRILYSKSASNYRTILTFPERKDVTRFRTRSIYFENWFFTPISKSCCSVPNIA